MRLVRTPGQHEAVLCFALGITQLVVDFMSLIAIEARDTLNRHGQYGWKGVATRFLILVIVF